MKATRCKVWSDVVGAGLLVAMAINGCASDADYDDPYAYYYPYTYDYYYPADLAYADAYYADYGYAYYGVGNVVPAGYAALKGTTSTGGPGTALRDLARGVNVCPDHATVTTSRVGTPCDISSATALTISKSIVLDGCLLPNGGQLDGTVEVEADLQLSEAECSPTTVIDVSYTSTTTDLVYVAAGGERVVVPLLTRTGAYTRRLGERPSTLTLQVDGTIESYDAKGSAVGNTTLSGTQTLVFLEADAGYTVDGTLTMQDIGEGSTVTVTGAGVTRAADCCYPTSGSIAVDRSEGDDDTWTFGPTCGDVARNGSDVDLKKCF